MKAISPIKPITETISSKTVTFGCDPEFFFERKGIIIGSEKVIDIKEGMMLKPEMIKPGSNRATGKGESKLIVDGVQAELNPRPDTCRARLGNEISECFRMLNNQLSKDPSLKVNFAATVKITKKELDTLAESSKVFGCMPSKNIDCKSVNAVKLRDPKKYKYRSAGGHIHLGHGGSSYDPVTTVMKDPERLIMIMDILVGNTCVLIDRDPGNKERRKVYGRAGEFRTPSYGIEYRTLSNFWLKSYPLMSFVMSLARMSVSLLACTTPGRDYERELLSLINPKKIQKAINTNNFEMAKANFEAIKPFLERVIPSGDSFPLNKHTIPLFEFFYKKGIDHWFKEDPIQHWISIPEGHTCGWENFLENTVKKELANEKA